MSYCPHADKIIAYCLGGLTVEEMKNFEIHLKSCEICQHELGIEKTIESELSEEFAPGFIEGRVMARWQLLGARDRRSFWLYAFRMAVSGISAAIAAFVLIPMIVSSLSGLSPNLSQYVQGIGELLGGLAAGNVFLAVLGFSCVAVFLASMYSLAQVRR